MLENHAFGYIKLTLERPLRLNFQASPERIQRLNDQTAFANLAESKKRKNKKEIEGENKGGRELQERIVAALCT